MILHGKDQGQMLEKGMKTSRPLSFEAGGERMEPAREGDLPPSEAILDDDEAGMQHQRVAEGKHSEPVKTLWTRGLAASCRIRRDQSLCVLIKGQMVMAWLAGEP